MIRQVVYGLLFISSICEFSIRAEIVNPLDGKHLRVHAVELPVTLEVKRNATQHVVDCYGVLCEYIVVLSAMLNFTYSFLTVKENFVETLDMRGGAIYFLIRDEVDYILSTTVATPFRNQVADLPTNWFMGPYGFIVPYPKTSINFMSTLAIFEYKVWVAMVGSIIVMLVCLRLTSWKIFRSESSHNSVQSQVLVSKRKADYNLQESAIVVGNLLSQGQHFCSKRLAVRFVAGAWCLACFFFVQMYSTTLTSHLMAPNQKPIANTMHELATNPGIALTLDLGYGFHQELIRMEKGANFSYLDDCKKLADKIKKDPHLLCKTTDGCLKRVRDEGNLGYIAPTPLLKSIMEEDLKRTGTCHYYLLKDTALNSVVFTFLQKHSPYTERISIAILQFQEAGLFTIWGSKFVPNPRQCMELDTRRDSDLKRLSLSNLSSVFIILGIGYVISFLVFVFEQIFHICPN